MFRSFKKALERNVSDAFSSTPSTHASLVNSVLHIGAHSLRLGSVFAEGGFSFVHIAKPLKPAATNIRFAVKRLPCQDPEAEAVVRQEIALLNAIPAHGNIVAFHGATFQNGHAFLLFDLIDGGTLPEFLARPRCAFSHEKRLAIFRDIVAAVAHLHAQSPPVAIRDVKLENVLYDRVASCFKLCDFGSATTVAKRYKTRMEMLNIEEDIANSCSAMYRAPEIADVYTKQFVCERVDVWALGCIWHAMLYDKMPFDGMSSLQILKGLRTIPSEPDYPEEFSQLLKSMLTVSPADRIDSIALLEEVDALLGRQTDDKLRTIGESLRRQRARDFGEEHVEQSEEEHDILDLNVLYAHNQQARASGTRNNITRPQQEARAAKSQLQTTLANPSASTTVVSSQDQGWANFDAAFGGRSNSESKAKPSYNVSTPNAAHEGHGTSINTRNLSFAAFVENHSGSSSQEPSQIEVGNHSFLSVKAAYPSEASSQGRSSEDVMGSLIDFGELQVRTSRPGQASSNTKMKNSEQRRTFARTDDLDDLINF